jgi:excisionase family DNA binding protein
MSKSRASSSEDEQKRLKQDFRARRLLELFQELSEDRKEALMAKLEKEAYSPEEVAGMLDKPVGTVRRWLRSGEIRASKLGRSWIIPKSEIERILKAGKEQIQ